MLLNLVRPSFAALVYRGKNTPMIPIGFRAVAQTSTICEEHIWLTDVVDVIGLGSRRLLGVEGQMRASTPS